jgi:4-amino-4-deoxy-L-arabinose transferase-like glycosyltransferase
VRWFLFAIIGLAIGVRLWGINFGLPYMYDHDESLFIPHIQDMIKTGDLNPHYFGYPSVFFYLNALAYIPYYLVGKLLGIFQTPADIPLPNMLAMAVGQTAMPSTVLLGRGLSALFSVATVPILFLIGRRVSGKPVVGLLAALSLAVSTNSISNSQVISPNAFLVFFIALTVWAALHVLQEDKLWPYLLAGVASGLTMSTKYNGVMIVLVPVGAHFLRAGWAGFKDRRLYALLALVPVVFLLTTPYAVLDYPHFITEALGEAAHYSTGHPGMEGDTVAWYATYLWQGEGPLIVLAVLEIGYGIIRRVKPTLVLAAFPVIYFLFISSFEVRNDRTVLPLVPFLFVLGWMFVVRGFSWLRTRHLPPGAQALAAGLAAVVLLAAPVLTTVAHGAALTTRDSRETARVWIERNISPGAPIAFEIASPYIDPQRYTLYPVGVMIDHSADWYKSHQVDYAVFSQGMFGRYFREPEKYPDEVRQYNALFAAFTPVRTFTDGGFEVRIYRIPHP